MSKTGKELSVRGVARQGAARAAISPVAWTPGHDLDLAEWARQGKRLGSIGRGASWWIGDWVNYGNTKFGEKYVRAAQVTGYDVQSLMNMAYVAGRYEFSRRREKLSWSHHAEVAGLPQEERDRWLTLAESRHISVHGLREELRSWRAREKKALTGAEDATAGQAIDVLVPDETARCPKCGYALHDALPGAGDRTRS